MSEKEHRPAWPALYAMLYRSIVDVAREHGYAAALHGSLATDLDVLCAPWTEESSPAEALVAAIKERLGALDLGDHGHPDSVNPARKPHGRLAWSLLLTAGAYVDLSIMPRTTDP